MQSLIKVIEELYSSKFSRDLTKLEQGGKSSNRSKNLPFYVFVADFYTNKFKSRRLIE